MVSKLFFFIPIVIASAILPTVTPTESYLVGNHIWKTGIDFQAWANENKFYVGDELLFVYLPQHHNVFKVNETGFRNCIVPPIREALGGGSGDDKIVFTMPGKLWFICGMEDNCLNGMKVEMTVHAYEHVALPPTPTPLPSPPSPSAPSPSAAQHLGMIWFQVTLATVVALVIIAVGA